MSTSVRCEELADMAPEDFTMRSVPRRFAEVGDLHAGIGDAIHDLSVLLE